MTTSDIADLCERLRRPGRNTCGMETNNPVNPDGPKAANTLERQAAEIERLRGALHFYADHHDYLNAGPWGINSDDFGNRARAALTGEDAATLGLSGKTQTDARTRGDG
jgi:hypothetical protein